MPGKQKQHMKTPDIGTLLTEKSGKIHGLYRHVKKLIDIQEQLKTMLPAPLNEHITVANLANDSLTIYTDSAAWAARLRFNIPEMLKSLNLNNICTSVKSIRIKVIPPDNTQLPPHEQKLSISNDTALLLEHVADTIGDPDLRESLLKLSRNR